MLVVAAALLLQSPSDSSALRHAGGRAARTMTAVRIEHPPVLDGKLDDPAWHEAKGVGGFIETDPREESSPAESTTVMIVYDDAAVYVGARPRRREILAGSATSRPPRRRYAERHVLRRL